MEEVKPILEYARPGLKHRRQDGAELFAGTFLGFVGLFLLFGVVQSVALVVDAPTRGDVVSAMIAVLTYAAASGACCFVACRGLWRVLLRQRET